jgi:hypothetical protein
MHRGALLSAWLSGLILILAGCTTPYQPKPRGLLGLVSSAGYFDKYLGDDTYLIAVRVNRYTDEATAYEYFHRRAGELCGDYDVLGINASKKTKIGSFGNSLSYSEEPRVYGRVKCRSVEPTDSPDANPGRHKPVWRMETAPEI